MKFYAIFQPEPEGGYTVYIPALPGCVTYGKNMEEAQEMIQEAMELYLETENRKVAEVPHDDSQSFIKTLSYA